MPTYDAVRFSPPAPVGAVDLRHAESGKIWANVPMLLDTGADVALVPSACLSCFQIQADPQTYELLAFDGTRSTVAAVYLDLILLGLTFRGRFLTIGQPEGILGRDILNHLNITFRGPALQWELVK